MVRKVEYTLFDDFTGEPADRTVVFGFAGSWFELDLTDANAAEIVESLTRWSTAGRRRTHNSSSDTASGTRTQDDRTRAAAIRSWAREEGMDVPALGRIAKNVIHAYDTRTTRTSRRGHGTRPPG